MQLLYCNLYVYAYSKDSLFASIGDAFEFMHPHASLQSPPQYGDMGNHFHVNKVSVSSGATKTGLWIRNPRLCSAIMSK